MPFLHVAVCFQVDVFGCVNERWSNVAVLPPQFHTAVMGGSIVDVCVLIRLALTVFSWSGNAGSAMSFRIATFTWCQSGVRYGNLR